jgi:hypothetical protein
VWSLPNWATAMSGPGAADLERATGYLAQISPDIERGEWVKVLMALKNTFADSGEIVARGWSTGGDSYRKRDFDDTWRSLDYAGPITLGTLAHLSGHQPRIRETKPILSTTADYALRLWKEAREDAVKTHPYAVTKKITHDFAAKRGTASGRILGRGADCIIVPMQTLAGEFTGVECINAEGGKQTFGKKGALILGYPEGAREIHVCEGWATAYALSQIFPQSFACAVTFGCGEPMERTGQALANTHKVLVKAHIEGEDNRDAWDYWDAGEADAYRAMVQASA